MTIDYATCTYHFAGLSGPGEMFNVLASIDPFGYSLPCYWVAEFPCFWKERSP
jgi:hypothetical protein